MRESCVQLPDRNLACHGDSSIHTFWKKGSKHITSGMASISIQLTSRRTHCKSQQTDESAWQSDAFKIKSSTPLHRFPSLHASSSTATKETLFVSILVTTRACYASRSRKMHHIRTKAGFNSHAKGLANWPFHLWETFGGLEKVCLNVIH